MSEQELIEACNANQRRGQQALFELYKRKVMGICLRYARNRPEADDILQEAFIRIFSSLRNKTTEIQSLSAWVFRITVNTAINAYHKRKIEFKTLDEISHDEGYGTESPLEQLHTKDLLHLVQQMPEGYRLIFNLYVIEGFDHNEIAEKIGISSSTSRSQLTHAKEWLKQRLRKESIQA